MDKNEYRAQFLTDVVIVLGRFGKIFVAQNTDCGCTLAEPLPLLRCKLPRLICQLQLVIHHLKPALINVYEVIRLIEQIYPDFGLHRTRFITVESRWSHGRSRNEPVSSRRRPGLPRYLTSLPVTPGKPRLY